MYSVVGVAGFWIGARQIVVRGANLIQLLLVASVVSAGEMGVYAAAVLAYNFVESITLIGFGHALIQKSEVDDSHISTLFIVNIIRGVVLAGLVFSLAYPVSRLFSTPEAAKMISFIGLVPLLIGFQHPAMVLLQKELRMEKEFMFHVVGAIVNFISSIVLVNFGFGAWSLIIGMIFQSISQVIISYWIHKYMPVFRFSLEAFNAMFQFGKWLMMSQAVKYFSINLPSWVIGHVLGVVALGQYTIGARFSISISSELTSLASSIAFPTFSKYQGDLIQLKKVYLKSQKVVLSLSMLLFSNIICVSKLIVEMFIWDGDYSNIVVINVLSVVGLVQSIGSQVDILKSLGKVRMIALVNSARLALVFCFIFWFTRKWGVIGSVSAILLGAVVFTIPVMIIILNTLKISLLEYFKCFVPPVLAFGLVFGVFEMLSLIDLFGSLRAVLHVIVCSLSYLFLLFLLDRIFGSCIIEEWMRLFRRK